MQVNRSTRNRFQEQFEQSQVQASQTPDHNRLQPGRPIQLLSISKSGQMDLNQQALEVISGFQKVGFVAVVGKMRTGKSFLLNKLLRLEGKGFRVDSATSACTEGIWMWSRPEYNAVSDTYIFFLDTQGTDSLQKNSDNDAKIFAMACLLSTFFIYNSVGAIDQRSLAQMEMITTLSNNIRTDDNVADKDNQDRLYLHLPRLLWLLRDFTLRIEDERGKTITANQYLENCLNDNSAGNANVKKTKKSIAKYFKERECMTIVRPTGEESDLYRLDTLPDYMLRKEFTEGINKLRLKILQTTPPKLFNGTNISGFNVCGMISNYSDAFNEGKVPSIKSAWQDAVEQEQVSAFNMALEKYQTLLKEQFPDDEPKGKEIYQSLRKIREETLKVFESVAPPHSDTYETKLKQTLNKKQQEIIDMNEQINEYFNKKVLNQQSVKLRTKLQSQQYNDPKDITKDLQELKKNYQKYSKGENKNELFSDFMLSMTPLIAEIGQKKTRVVEDKTDKILEEERIRKDQLQASQMQSMRSQIDAKANANNMKVGAQQPKLPPKPTDPKKEIPRKEVGCCTGDKCLIM